MTDAVSAISSSSVSSTGSSSGSQLLEEIKKKLEALGIDTSNITTESQAQTKLQEAQAAQAAAQTSQTQGQQSSQGASSMSTIQDEAKSFALELGVRVGTNDDIDTIFSSISDKIASLQSTAGTDVTKKAEADRYQEEYSQLYSEYTSAQSSQSMLTNSLSAMASYNKAALGLS